jgi:hypothetical protein
MSIHTDGIETDSFSEAVQKLKNLNKDIEIKTEDENSIHYFIPQSNDSNFTFTVWGCMNNEPLKIIK